jgi:magnesium chelatase family protein
VRPWEADDPLSDPEPSSSVRARVTAARERQHERYAGTPWRLNADVPGPELAASWPLTDAGRALLERQLYDARLTRRGATRVHRLAWTIADLAGDDVPAADAVALALRLRNGDPLTEAQVQRVAG